MRRFEVEAIKDHKTIGRGAKKVSSQPPMSHSAAADHRWPDIPAIDQMERLQRERKYVGARREFE